MADFSEYGGPSEEWTALAQTLPKIPDMSQDELRRVTNDGREGAAREEMKKLLPKVSLKDHSIQARDGTTLEARSYRPSSAAASEKLPIYIRHRLRSRF